MSETPAPASAPATDTAPGPAQATASAPRPGSALREPPPAWPVRPVWLLLAAALVLLAALASVALVTASGAQQRVKALETELVRRQQDSAGQASEARTLSRQAEQTAREVAAKMALLEARVAETTLQRSQLEELIQNLSRSRDESVLVEVEAAVRVAMQQAAITGSAEPLVQTLRQADERLARYSQPRLERVRRAVAQDLERTRTAGVTDIALLTLRLDEAIRLVDELPLLAQPGRAMAQGARGGQNAGDTRAASGGVTRAAAGQAAANAAQAPAPTAGEAAALKVPAAAVSVAAAPSAASAASAASDPADTPGLWASLNLAPLRGLGQQLWQEVKSLVRVSRIDQPEAMLVAPEQAWFLRENLKLRLLNARLALLSRQFDTAQSDLRDAQAALGRYFDGAAPQVQGAREVLAEVAGQARLVNVPRPEATLAAIAAVTATAGR